ncbi:NAD(P)-binding protein [Mycena leptocephala]|nr:NAD(P)-binding protein [Mycena leptocephala]
MNSKGVALVTGAAQGIGRSIALRLADDGFDVGVNDVALNSEKLDTLVNEIKKKGRSSSKYIADVSQDEQVKGMVEQVVERHGSLDVMIANAGVVGKLLPFTEVSGEEWDRVMNINSKGSFLCYKYAGLQMVEQGRGGRIIGASSVAGKQAVASQAAYSASKFAVRALTQAAALEFGAHGITVNAYAPGAIDTPMLGLARDMIVEQFTEMSPLKKIGVPEDIASLVSFLVSEESQFITGYWLKIWWLYTPNSTDFFLRGCVSILRFKYRVSAFLLSPSSHVFQRNCAPQGIGRSVALRLADDGFDVAVNDIVNTERLDALVDEIQKKGRASSKHIADVSQDEQVKEMVEQVVQQHSGLDVMIANAGILGAEVPFLEVSAEQWDRVLGVNARGHFLCYKYAGLQMIKQGRGGSIIGASSLAGKQVIAGLLAAYSASKFAVRGLTQAAALELGPHNITVNAYAPGAIDTPMLVGSSVREEKLDQIKQMTPLKRVGIPEDIASLVSFLASKESRFITGQTISINGGLYFD